MKIEIFGAGCKDCQELTLAVEQAVHDLRLDDAEVLKVEDFRETTARGVMLTPALAIDGEVVSVGAILEAREVMTMITTALMKAEG